MGLEFQTFGAGASRQPSRKYSYLVALTALIGIAGWTRIFVQLVDNPHATVVPINADALLRECAALSLTPGMSHSYSSPPFGISNSLSAPQTDFKQRDQSDRFESGTPPTLVTNATIWTGNNAGGEVITSGQILLDKGIIKFIGQHVPEELIRDKRSDPSSNVRQLCVILSIVIVQDPSCQCPQCMAHPFDCRHALSPGG
jgi:hypothetical protein